MKSIQQSVGIDISKATFTACIFTRQPNKELFYSKVKTFKNEKTGYNQLLRWVRKECDKKAELNFLMEATGVYYERLAYHLHKIDQQVNVVLPNTSKHYFKSLNVKSKTDEIDAKVLSRFACEREHRNWEPPKKLYLQLRNLSRFAVQLKEQKTALTNIKHSKESSQEIEKFILRSNKQLIKQIDKQIKECEQKIEQLIQSDSELHAKVKKIQTIKGVGVLTIVTIIAETLGFQQVKNVKQLASYAGYDVVQRESGTSIKGKTRISKKGNRYIRNALYFPAMVASRYNDDLKKTYLRIIKNKPSKMIGQVAIQRKLLILIYTLWKNDCCFIEGYKKK